MYTVYNYRSIVKFYFRGDPGQKKKGLATAHAYELINNLKEMGGHNGLKSYQLKQIGIFSNPFMPRDSEGENRSI